MADGNHQITVIKEEKTNHIIALVYDENTALDILEQAENQKNFIIETLELEERGDVEWYDRRKLRIRA